MHRRLQLWEAIVRLLADASPSEQGCFCLLREGRGLRGRRLLAVDPIFPPSDAWETQGTGHLRPTARWVSAAVSAAVSSGAGLLFVHSHPDPAHPPELSLLDETAVHALAETLAPMLEGPFAAVVTHSAGWSGMIWDDVGLVPIDRVVSVGRILRPLSPRIVGRIAEGDEALDARQADALGDVHSRLRDLEVAVVGSGGLGSPLAEQIVRMGVAGVTLVDHDVLDTPSNVRRVFGSTAADLRGTTPPAKVDVVGRHLDQFGLAPPVRRVRGDIRQEQVFRALLDADVVISCTDTHGSRAVVNDLPSTCMLPVVDMGVRVGSKANGALVALAAEVRVLTPTTPCLWCRKAISADVARAENLPAHERQKLEREGYLVGGVGDPAPSVVALTVLGAGLGACALLTLLSEEGDVAPCGYIVDGFLAYAMETQPTQPVEGCRCRKKLGLGDFFTTVPPGSYLLSRRTVSAPGQRFLGIRARRIGRPSRRSGSECGRDRTRARSGARLPRSGWPRALAGRAPR